MCDSKFSNSIRILAGAISTLLLVALLFSGFYIAFEADHDCTGEDCPICICIHQCETILNQLGYAAALLFSVVVPIFSIALFIMFSAHVFMQDTLVSRKVRMND